MAYHRRLLRSLHMMVFITLATLSSACGSTGLAAPSPTPPEPTRTLAPTSTWTPTAAPSSTSTAIPPTPTLTPNPTLTATPTLDPKVIQNPDFEADGGWTFKPGALDIKGAYSDEWRSSGGQSYKITVYGDDTGCTYYFQPGQRSNLSQTVDLTGIAQIQFDLNLKPDYTFLNQGIARMLAEVRLDKDIVWSSGGKGGGVLANREILLEEGKYTGSHQLTFSLTFASTFCDGGGSQRSSVEMYVDNVRLNQTRAQ